MVQIASPLTGWFARLRRRWPRAAGSAGLLAMLGFVLSLVPAVLVLDERIGLALLFAVRGPVDPPPEVVVVSISRATGERAGLPENVMNWPRDLHGRLIDSLTAAGAAAIAFDISFKEPRDEDSELAESLRRAGNVILVERMTSLVKAEDDDVLHVLDQPEGLVRELADAALATGPFTLPKLPELSDRVSQFWTFGRVDDETPSLPVLALQAYLLDRYDNFASLLEGASPSGLGPVPSSRDALLANGLGKSMQSIRNRFRGDPDLAPALRRELAAPSRADERAALQALVDVYGGSQTRYLNLYGPPQTIEMIPYDLAAASAQPLDVAGKMVFVGFAEPRQSDEDDAFVSVFTEPTGEKLSGVEIGATAFANLLHGRTLTPMPMPAHLLLVLGWGVLLGVAAASSTRAAVGLAIVGVAAYLAVACWAFAAHAYWIPILVPLMVQAPLAALAALSLNYVELGKQRKRVLRALECYVPTPLFDRLVEESGDAATDSQLLRGTCLFTDAEEYTTVAEALPPAQLAALINDYFAALFEVVVRHGGIVSNTSGDSMVALWAAVAPDPGSRARACRAALEIREVVDAFNRDRGTTQLPTRVGLESGEVLLGNIGGGSRYEYRAVGDIVNTASRLQGLNRLLRTRVLASAPTVAGAENLGSRDLGVFLLRGKRTPIRAHELFGFGDGLDARHAELSAPFAAALNAFEQQRWDEAESAFGSLRARFPDDGPSAFYAEQSMRYRADPAAWRGAVVISEK